MELNLSKQESIKNLNLRKEKVALCLEKKSLLNQVARVALVLDYSGSMSDLYRNGKVQEAIERLLPIAMQFDDNGTMEMWIFENGFTRLPDINLENFYGYVENEILRKGYRMGGTCYAPVMNDIHKKYMMEEPAQLPDYVMFITDGDNSDKSKTNEVITELSHYPIFWQFVGIGSARFSYLESLDNLSGRYVDNANFFSINNLNHVSDEELYNKLLAEFPIWLELPQVKEMLSKVPSMQNMQSNKKGLFGKFFG